MPLEQAQYIDSLTPEWPLGSDPRSAGDDHIRMIKQVLQNSFPGVTGAVTATQQQLNDLATHFRYEAPDEANGYKGRMVAVNDDYTETIGIRARALTAAELADPAMHDHVVTFNAIMGMIYPVGGVYVTSRTENPAQILGFGTWVQRSGIMYGAGNRSDVDGMNRDIPMGDVPGHWRVHYEHVYPATVQIDNGWAADNGAHLHGGGVRNPADIGDAWVYGAYGGNLSPGRAISLGDGDDYTTPQQATSTDGQHGHYVSGTVAFGNGMLPFAQPGHAFNVWERTA